MGEFDMRFVDTPLSAGLDRGSQAKSPLTVEVVSAPPTLSMGSSRGTTGSHWVSSGSTTPVCFYAAITVAIAVERISPGTNGQGDDRSDGGGAVNRVRQHDHVQFVVGPCAF